MEETQLNRMYAYTTIDTDYPEKLRLYEDMPETIYAIGKLPDCHRPCAAIVGARNCSAYGRVQAFRYARMLSSMGVQIISGMAYGVDTQAHKGALEGGTPTFAVLAGGADVIYPKSNRTLYYNIIEKGGGVISEQLPGTQARNYFFPQRNRIISALSDLVLVVEAREKSGSLITANWALEQGKSVYAIPGMVTDELSRGCNKLIFDGAGIAYTPEVLLEELGINSKNKIKTNENTEVGLATDQNLVYSCLDLRPKSIDFVIRETGLSAKVISNILLELQFAGYICEVSRHHYIKIEDSKGI